MSPGQEPVPDYAVRGCGQLRIPELLFQNGKICLACFESGFGFKDVFLPCPREKQIKPPPRDFGLSRRDTVIGLRILFGLLRLRRCLIQSVLSLELDFRKTFDCAFCLKDCARLIDQFLAPGRFCV